VRRRRIRLAAHLSFASAHGISWKAATDLGRLRLYSVARWPLVRNCDVKQSASGWPPSNWPCVQTQRGSFSVATDATTRQRDGNDSRAALAMPATPRQSGPVSVHVDKPMRYAHKQWLDRPPQRCTRGHWLLPGHMIVATLPCSCGQHICWQCECGAARYEPALLESCSLAAGLCGSAVIESGVFASA
jgi:hypothetical protein